MAEIHRREDEHLSSEYEPEELAAGVKKFEMLGIMNTVLAISEKYNYKLDEVFDIDYATIFVILLKEKISNDFHKRYMEVLRKDADNRLRSRKRD